MNTCHAGANALVMCSIVIVRSRAEAIASCVLRWMLGHCQPEGVGWPSWQPPHPAGSESVGYLEVGLLLQRVDPLAVCDR